jgi:hypothetical protein
MKKRVLAVIALIALLVVPTVGMVTAQPSGQGLEISPPLIDEKVDPGQSIKVDIKVRNVTSTEVIATGQIDDFVSDGEDGQPKILVQEGAEPSPYTFKPWVADVPDLRLAPREAKTASITITVPQDAAPGGHYGVVRFTAKPVGLDQTGVSLSASIGSLVLLNVSGDVKVEGSVEQFTLSQGDKQGTFFEKGPLTITERIKNSGNVHFKPAGSVKITDTFGKEVANLPVNKDGGNVLPASIRKFEQQFQKDNLFGRYKADLNLTYGNDQTMTSTITFWVIPYKMVALALGALLLIIFLIIFFLKRFKKHVAEEVHHEDEVKYGHEKAPAQHIPGTVHHPEGSENQEDDQDQPKPPTDNTPKIQ